MLPVKHSDATPAIIADLKHNETQFTPEFKEPEKKEEEVTGD
jgi:hypothetical protein